MALLSNQKATVEIRRRAECSDNVIFRPHATKRMADHGIDHAEVLKCLTLGVVNDAPERKTENNPYRYKMDLTRGKHSYSVVVEIELADDLLVITAF